MRFVFAVLLIGVLNLALRADDEEARRKADDGAARFRDGDFHGAAKAYDQAHFLADGTAESAVDFPIYEVSVKKTRLVKVSGDGKITISNPQ